MSDDEYYKFNVITPFEKLTKKKIKALEKELNILGQLVPMEWQQNENTKEIAELKKKFKEEERLSRGRRDDLSNQIAELKEDRERDRVNIGNLVVWSMDINTNREVLRDLQHRTELVGGYTLNKAQFSRVFDDKYWEGKKLKTEKKEKLSKLCKCGKSYRAHFLDDSYKTCKYLEPKEITEPENNDPCGIEGKYELWTREELENECNVLIENMDALCSLHEKEEGELIEEIVNDLNSDAIKKHIIEKWQGRLK